MAEWRDTFRHEVLDMSDTSNNVSAWTQAGFPFGFRFRNPRDVFHTICQAMAERSINFDQTDHVDTSKYAYRPEVWGVDNRPEVLRKKHNWYPGEVYNGTGMFEFMRDRIFLIASRYCDAEKAHDFENYPELENWTPESLEEKLKGDYVKFSHFCDREKYLIFIYKVLNLCSVRRVPVFEDYEGSGRERSTGLDAFYSGKEAKESLLKRSFRKSDQAYQSLAAYHSSAGEYKLYQYGTRFITWLDKTRPCDIKFYAYAKDDLDEFCNFGVKNIKPDSWFCAGEPDIVESSNKYQMHRDLLIKELEQPDSNLPEIPVLERNSIWESGFSLLKWGGNTYNKNYGYAVRDQRKYLKFFER